tara:strand:+ start:117 stop:341 length:225 start_codon:yes stop_codon:yes gene_type:complete
MNPWYKGGIFLNCIEYIAIKDTYTALIQKAKDQNIRVVTYSEEESTHTIEAHIVQDFLSVNDHELSLFLKKNSN